MNFLDTAEQNVRSERDNDAAVANPISATAAGKRQARRHPERRISLLLLRQRQHDTQNHPEHDANAQFDCQHVAAQRRQVLHRAAVFLQLRAREPDAAGPEHDLEHQFQVRGVRADVCAPVAAEPPQEDAPDAGRSDAAAAAADHCAGAAAGAAHSDTDCFGRSDSVLVRGVRADFQHADGFKGELSY